MSSSDWINIYKQLKGNEPKLAKPLIGLTGNFTEGNCTLAAAYYTSVLKADGIPLVIPPIGNEAQTLPHLLQALDGMVFTGGADLNPLLVDEEPIPQLRGINAERDQQELLMARITADLHMPVVGICRGIQVIAAAFGGTIYQDIQTQYTSPVCKHSQDADRWVATHTVDISPDSVLYDLFRSQKLSVNSFHHQAVKTPPLGFKVTATASDGIIEAMESVGTHRVLAVQWHPECFIMHNDESMMPIFHWLTKEALLHKTIKNRHENHN
ncbi:MAG: gamma-glutamyl-gamma-aminobutyrate hydrolase family protein [Bacteroidales bacterium]|nr:gamma-glutamyl-gamma-aminobutyrate hydrolase family protein [Bacteroidales bacterium]